MFQAQFNEAKRSADNARDKAKRCLTDAQNLSGVTSPNDISPEKQEVHISPLCSVCPVLCMSQQYDSFPNDLGEVEELIHENQTKAELCYSLDTGVCCHSLDVCLYVCMYVCVYFDS